MIDGLNPQTALTSYAHDHERLLAAQAAHTHADQWL